MTGLQTLILPPISYLHAPVLQRISIASRNLKPSGITRNYDKFAIARTHFLFRVA